MRAAPSRPPSRAHTRAGSARSAPQSSCRAALPAARAERPNAGAGHPHSGSRCSAACPSSAAPAAPALLQGFGYLGIGMHIPVQWSDTASFKELLCPMRELLCATQGQHNNITNIFRPQVQNLCFCSARKHSRSLSRLGLGSLAKRSSTVVCSMYKPETCLVRQAGFGRSEAALGLGQRLARALQRPHALWAPGQPHCLLLAVS